MFKIKIFLFCLLFIFSCTKDELAPTTCTAELLERLDMVPYEGQKIGCGNYIELYQFEGEYYYLLGNPCADMVQYPINCNGEPDPLQVSGAWYLNFFEDAQSLGIVGFYP